VNCLGPKNIGDVFAKDEWYKKLSFSYEQMVDEGRILNFGDYHEGNLYLREYCQRKSEGT
jgi:hypothetical protein